MRIYALMTIYNRKKLTLDCLRCVSNQNYTNFEIVVVDDGSIDGSVEAIKENFPKVTVIKTTGNLWWTASMNKGVKYILSKA